MINMMLLRTLFISLILFGSILSPVFGQDQDTNGVDGLQIVFGVSLKPAYLKTEDVRATAEVVARRLEALDIHPYTVQVLGGKAIQVQLPGMEDSQPVIDALMQTALLELVDFSGLNSQVSEFEGSTVLTTGWAANPNLPPREGAKNNPLTDAPFETILTGADFVSVATSLDSIGQWAINFELTDDAAQIFGDFTQAHIGEPLAIALDGQILSIPIVQSRLDKQGVISSNFTESEARRLAAQLRAGALPLPLTLVRVDTIETVRLDT
jgi:preprotein translocase subunit SecD